MKNNKILRYGGIAALILIALYAFTFFSNDARGYVQADTSVAVSYTHLTLPTTPYV